MLYKILRNSILAFIFLIHVNSFSQTPTASFISLPASSSGTVTVCVGQAVTFVNTSSNTLSGSTYTWNFGVGAIPATASGIGPHTVTYSSPISSTTASLNVNNNNGQQSNSSLNVVVNLSPISNLTLLNTASSFGTSTTNGQILFRNCTSDSITSFQFSSSYASSVTQTFNWGDGSPNSVQTDLSATNQISHNYGLGQFVLTHTVVLANACQVVKQYFIFNGEAPIITVSGSGQTTCLPFPYSIDVLSNNIPGTVYTVSFTDGSPVNIFSSTNDTTISHVFNTSSCGESYQVGPITIENAFQATIIAQNGCGTSFATLGPITISTGTDAIYSYSPASPICEGEPVTFTNQSYSGENVNQNGCTTNYGFYWSVLEPNGWNVTSGSLGSNNGAIGSSYDFATWNTPVQNELEITFDTPGDYHVWLYTGNACGIDSVEHLVTILPNSRVNINPINPFICSGNLSDTIFMSSSIEGYLITWEVTDVLNVDGFNPVYGSGTTTDTIFPVQLINTSNILGYVVINASVGCSDLPPAIDTLFVYPQGNLIVSPLQDYLCSNETTDIDISSNLQNATFTWTASFPSIISGASSGSGNTISQTLFNSGTTIANVTYTIYIGNVTCPGDSIVVIVAVQPGINLNQNNDTTLCPGSLLNPIDYISSPVGATYTWTNNNTSIGIGASGNGQVPTWTTPANNTGNPVVGTITVTALLDPSCPPSVTDFIVTISPSANLEVSTLDTLVCSGQSHDVIVQSNVSSAIITWTAIAPPSISGSSNGNGNPGNIDDILINDGSTSSNDTVFYTVSISNVQCPSSNLIVSVTVQPQISMNDIPNILVCPGQPLINPVDFSTIPSGGNFTWTNSNTAIGLPSSGSGQIASWNAPSNTTSSPIVGNITISAQLNGCPIVQDVFSVTINPTPDYVYTLNPINGFSCISTTATINGIVSVPNLSILWSGPNIISSQVNDSIIVGSPGTYVISMTDTTTGCSSNELIQIDPPTQINITDSSSENITCYGLSNGSISISTDNFSPLTYTWTPSVGSGPIISGLAPGSYTVNVSNSDLCEDQTTIIITEPSLISITPVDSIGSECGEANGSLSVIASGGQGPYSYNWDNGNTGANNTEIDEGNYSVTVTDNSGCSVSNSFDLGCTELIPIIIPQFISPNGDGKNDTWIIQNLELYPDNKVWVYNRWGNLVFSSEPYDNANGWDGTYTGLGKTGPLPASTYFYLIDTMKKSQDVYKGYLEVQP